MTEWTKNEVNIVASSIASACMDMPRVVSLAT